MPTPNSMASRAKEHLPSVLVTMLSIVQALALELMWNHISEQAHLDTLTWVSLLSWLQILTTLLGVLLVWLIYTSMTMRFSWVPTTTDSVFPFLIGIVEYTLIGALGLQRLGLWLLLLAAVYGAMTWASQHILRRARLEPDNDAFFAHVRPATWRDFLPAISVIAGLSAMGIYFASSGDQDVPALLALLFAFVAIAHQLWANDRYWRRSMAAH